MPPDDDTQIEESETPEEQPADSPGVEDGTVLNTTNQDDKGNPVEEKVVYDYDDEGNQVGWHKEVVS